MKIPFVKKNASRLEGFSDAVFALSATLLVVSLEVPGSISELLTELRGFIAFAVTFTALILIWSVHNSFFRRYGLQDGVTIAINSFLLFVVLFYVYPLKFMVDNLVSITTGWGGGSKLISTEEELKSLFIVYGLGFVFVFSAFALLYLRAFSVCKTYGFTYEQRRLAWFNFRHYLIFVCVGSASILLAVFDVGTHYGLPGFAYFLIGPVAWLHGSLSGSSKSPTPPPLKTRRSKGQSIRKRWM